MAGWASTKVKQGSMGDLGYIVYTYDSGTDDHGTITIPKSVQFVDWCPYVKRASSTINYTSTPGTITIAALTAGDKGSVTVWVSGGV